MYFQLKTYEFCKQYMQLSAEEKIKILKELAFKYDFDKEAAKKAAASYVSLEVLDLLF